MPDRLTDVEAKFLLDQSNRRAKLLKTVQGTFLGYLCSYIIYGSLGGLGAVMLISILVQAIWRVENSISTSLSLAPIPMVTIAIYVLILNKRMDALVALLREDGALQSTPPVAKLLDKQ
jgi:hypothetical protein